MRRVLSCSEKVLAQSLRELERNKIIYRTVYPEVPLRVEYRLTPAGEKLRQIYDLIYLWSLEQLKETGEEIAPLTFKFHDDVRTSHNQE
jgi:DNA-binding HxlR family transcriptional regulator